jgi:serine/threonine protein phosphatase 1
MSSDSARRVIIGDVHGHFQGLQQLLQRLDLKSEDSLYFLGDLVDRGPESAKVVEFVKSKGYPCLMGNHEQMMLAAFNEPGLDDWAMEMWLRAGGNTTLASYQDLDCLAEHLDWLSTLPTYLDLDDLWLVHAGVHPYLPLEAQTSQEFCWIRSEFHSTKEPFFPNKLIISGHTITFTFPGITPGQIVSGPGWLDIDTGAYHSKSGWLTALDVTQQGVYQVNVWTGQERVRSYAEAITSIAPEDPSTQPSLVSAV